MAKGPKRPTRDEFQMEEMGERLVEAFQEGTELLLSVWNWADPVRGIITKMDSRTRLVHVQYEAEVVKVPFMDIMRIDSPRD